METTCHNIAIPSSLASGTAKEAVLVANTPSFLLERLRKDISVQYVSTKLGPYEIVKCLRDTLSKGGPQDALTLVSLYVYLVALSSVDPSDRAIWKEIESIDLSPLQWGDIIRRLMTADAVPTTAMEFTLPD